jgi:hypothetical protein
MTKPRTFRPWQPGLLPPSASDWLSADHQVHVLLQVSEFRGRNLEALSELFAQILRLCQQAGRTLQELMPACRANRAETKAEPAHVHLAELG